MSAGNGPPGAHGFTPPPPAPPRPIAVDKDRSGDQPQAADPGRAVRAFPQGPLLAFRSQLAVGICWGGTFVSPGHEEGAIHIPDCLGIDSQAFALRIAQCFNSHDELMACLKKALEQWNVQFEGELDNDPWCIAARSAIAANTKQYEVRR